MASEVCACLTWSCSVHRLFFEIVCRCLCLQVCVCVCLPCSFSRCSSRSGLPCSCCSCSNRRCFEHLLGCSHVGTNSRPLLVFSPPHQMKPPRRHAPRPPRWCICATSPANARYDVARASLLLRSPPLFPFASLSGSPSAGFAPLSTDHHICCVRKLARWPTFLLSATSFLRFYFLVELVSPRVPSLSVLTRRRHHICSLYRRLRSTPSLCRLGGW